MDVEILQNDGAGSGRTTTLDPTVFDIEPNDHVIWLDVKRIQAHERQGTAKTKQRAEVRGSGRKLYRQKGTGNARVGDAQSPIRRGGGRAHGATPRKYTQNLNRKTKRLARRSALSYAAQKDGIRVVERLAMEHPSTGGLTDTLDALDIGDRKVFIITQDVEDEVYLSSRNLSDVSVQEVGSVNTVDLLDAEMLLFEEEALQTLTDTLSVAETEAA